MASVFVVVVNVVCHFGIKPRARALAHLYAISISFLWRGRGWNTI